MSAEAPPLVGALDVSFVERGDADTRREVQELWYDSVVAERGVDAPGADHSRGRLVDWLADQGNLFVARREGRVVGSVLTLDAKRDDLGFYRDYFGIPHGAPASVTTRLAIRPDVRGSRCAVALACATYAHAVRDGIEFDFVDTYRRAVPFFRRLGYRRLPGSFEHPQFGPSHGLRLSLLDVDHLRKVGSPLEGLALTPSLGG